MNKQGLLYHDGFNFWIGVSADGVHHNGTTIISSGNDEKGIKVSKPNGKSRTESYLLSMDDLSDSGWITLSLVSGINVAGKPLRYRKIGDIVFVEGRISFNKPTKTDHLLIATLPSGYRPQFEEYFYVAGSNVTVQRFRVTKDGEIHVDVIVPASGGTYVEGAIGWVDFYKFFFIN